MNPFKFGTIVDGDFFTDRVAETALLKQKLDSENHIVLISPRRFGKSSLVCKILSEIDRPQIHIDLQYSLSVDDFSAQIVKALFKIFPMERVRHAMTHFRVAPIISTNAVTPVVADEILQFTSCHSYYTQQLASQVWDLVQYNKVSDNVVESAIDALVTMHDLDYERLWQSLNRTDRFTLRQLAEAKQPMMNRSQAASTSYSSLLRLMKMGYVIKTTHYEIEDPFFNRWILQNNN